MTTPPLSKTAPRYLLFAGIHHYAMGGAHDLIGVFEELDKAIKSAPAFEWDVYEWWHVYDTTTGTFVAGSKEQAYGAPPFKAGTDLT